MHGRVLGIRPAGRPKVAGVKVNPAAWGDVDLRVSPAGRADMRAALFR